MRLAITVLKKDGTTQKWDREKIRVAVGKSAYRATETISDTEMSDIINNVEKRIAKTELEEISVDQIHNYVEQAIKTVNPIVAESYMDYRNYRKDALAEYEQLIQEADNIRYNIDEKENSNKEGTLASTKQALIRSGFEKNEYMQRFLTREERQATKDGYIYPHDMDMRLDTVNCSLFDIQTVITGGFEMGNMWYNEPKTLDVAFDVIGDVVLSAASQQYGGFTLPEIDFVLEPFAEKSYKIYVEEYNKLVKDLGMDIDSDRIKKKANAYAMDKIQRDFEQGFQGWEYKFNTVASSRGDYPFTTLTFGRNTSKFGKMACKSCLKVRMKGQGKDGFKKPVLFPKLVFLFDKNIHGEGCVAEDVFEIGIACSKKTMYPDWLSLTGEGYVSEIYKKYGRVISPMGCRAFLSPWFERGGWEPEDENDKPIFVGRFNIGAISLHLPMILAKSREEGRDFFEVLDYYLNLIRKLHCRTYDYLGTLKASHNPLGFCYGGFYGGHLQPTECIAPILETATASFGITALNELQRLYNGKSITEDGKFALDVLKYINDRVNEFKEEDHHLYAIYGTPAESLCYKQIKQFRSKYGIVKNVSDREYVSNSFHCHVTEDITPTKKQDLEYRFWNYCNGGKIQYVRYPINYNTDAVKSLVLRAMDMGLYEGVNLSLAYCEQCGHEELEMDVCPICGSNLITKIDRMNGYLSYSMVHGDTRLNYGKMAEIAERKSM